MKSRETGMGNRESDGQATARKLLVALVVACALVLAGCGSLLGGPKTPARIYAPEVRVQPDPSWPTVDWQLSIGTPASSELLDSTHIAVQPAPGTMQVYKGAVWTDTAPELVQSTIVHAFEDSGRITAVSRFGGGLRGDFGLLLDLRAFQAVYRGGTPEATVELSAKLLQLRGTRVVAGRTFRRAVPAAGTAVDAVNVAFGQALSAIAGDVVGWTLTEGEKAASSPPPAEQADRPRNAQ